MLRGQEKFLFVSTKEPHGRGAKSTIPGWVREAIAAAYKDLSAGEHRESFVPVILKELRHPGPS